MARSILELIGNTPVVEIKKMNPNPEVTLYAKLESLNPGGSVKDRIAKYMIEKAEERGDLKKGKVIVEATSGNTGIGLAMVARVKGYKCKIVMPETMSMERRKALKAYGAELILTSGDKGMDGAIEEAKRLSEDPSYFWIDQFSNSDNPLAHYETTGPEILEQVGRVDMLVAGIGTSGTLMGVGKRLREANPGVEIIGVEPHPDSKIQGLKNFSESEQVPSIFEPEILTGRVYAEDERAFSLARQVAKEEGIFVGISSGAALAEALRRAEKMKQGNIVVIFPDGGDKYLSTDLFE